MEIEVRVHGRRELLRELQDAHLEVGVGALLEGLPEWLVVRPLYEERFVVAVPPAHELAGRLELELAELHHQPFIDRLACEFRDSFASTCAARGVEPLTIHRTEHDPWVESLVVAGIGVTVLPEHTLISPLTPRCRLRDLEVAREVCLWRSADSPRTPAGKLFWQALVARHSLGGKDVAVRG